MRYNLLAWENSEKYITFPVPIEEIHKIKCKYRYDDKKRETCGIKYKDCKWCLEYTNVIDDLIEYKYLCCNNSCQKRFNKEAIF